MKNRLFQWNFIMCFSIGTYCVLNSSVSRAIPVPTDQEIIKSAQRTGKIYCEGVVSGIQSMIELAEYNIRRSSRFDEEIFRYIVKLSRTHPKRIIYESAHAKAIMPCVDDIDKLAPY